MKSPLTGENSNHPLIDYSTQRPQNIIANPANAIVLKQSFGVNFFAHFAYFLVRRLRETIPSIALRTFEQQLIKPYELDKCV
jgi:hypothetical protein